MQNTKVVMQVRKIETHSTLCAAFLLHAVIQLLMDSDVWE